MSCCCAGPAWCTALAGSVSRMRSGTRRARSPSERGSGFRLQPYLTERMLQQSSWLAPLAAVAVQLRERLNGSGYPRGLSGAAISTPARVLAAADVYQAMLEPRPYRPALSPEDAAVELKSEVSAGRLDGDAVAAVLSSAGHAVARRREYPGGLTSREVDVLRPFGARTVESSDRRAIGHLAEDRSQPHRAHLHEDRRNQPCQREPVRRTVRPVA